MHRVAGLSRTVAELESVVQWFLQELRDKAVLFGCLETSEKGFGGRRVGHERGGCDSGERKKGSDACTWHCEISNYLHQFSSIKLGAVIDCKNAPGHLSIVITGGTLLKHALVTDV